LHLGIQTLGELAHACSARGRPHYAKIALAQQLPRGPGVYVFRDRAGTILYVGKAKDLRSRVKSYFYGDERKKVQDLVASVTQIDALETDGELEALVLEIRLIAEHLPRFNAHGKRWRRFAYLKLDPNEAWPRLKIARAIDPNDGATYLGPFATSGRATLAKEALEEAFRIRRCTRTMGRRTRFAPCVLADMGRCQAPCGGRTDPDRYGAMVEELRTAIRTPGALLRGLEARMLELAARERFEEAAMTRDRVRALADVLMRMRTDRWLTAGRLVVAGADGRRLELAKGALVRADGGLGAGEPIGAPVPRERADELSVVRSWVQRNRVRVMEADDAPAEPVDGGAELARLLGQMRAAEGPSRDRGPRRRGRDRTPVPIPARR